METQPFQVMAKPAGPACNLACTYCYYKDKRAHYPGARFRMEGEVLETFVRDYIACHEAWGAPEIVFSWQGGEPTLLGLEYFREVVALQERFRPNGRTVSNALQTNGVLLDDQWAAFLRDNGFLVGISIDGPAGPHDRQRPDKAGRPTFERVMKGLAVLRDNAVEFNTLTVVNRANVSEGRKIYRFLKNNGVRFMQFIPAVEREDDAGRLAGPPSPEDGEGPRRVTPWSVPPTGFGGFLCDVFDEWQRGDVGEVFVQLFDATLGQWLGEPPTLCVFAETCGTALAMEHNGDLYACDHYVYPGHLLGNIMERPLAELAGLAEQQRFGAAKHDGLPRHCLDCRYLFACNGGCPKHRFAQAPDGEFGLNYLCASYRRFFQHAEAGMETMAARLRAGQPAAIPGSGRIRATEGSGYQNEKVGRNDPCPCGSGRKFKRCCADERRKNR